MLSEEGFDFQDYPASNRGGNPVVETHRSAFSPAQLTPDVSPQHSGADSQPKNHNFWTIEYYQKYFDVNADDVKRRIVASMVPNREAPSYFDDNIGTKPDLYGPFWISTTLIFTIAISGNIANYLQHANANFHWKYDFHLVSYAATAIFCYTWIVPIALWAALKWTVMPNDAEIADEESKTSPSMMSLFCLYGYSLSVYVPVSVLWCIQVSWLQWLLVVTAALLSGLVLVYLLLPALRKSKHFIPLVGCMLGCHFLLAAGFMLYFFHVPAVDAIIPPLLVNTTPKPAS